MRDPAHPEGAEVSGRARQKMASAGVERSKLALSLRALTARAPNPYSHVRPRRVAPRRALDSYRRLVFRFSAQQQHNVVITSSARVSLGEHVDERLTPASHSTLSLAQMGSTPSNKSSVAGP